MSSTEGFRSGQRRKLLGRKSRKDRKLYVAADVDTGWEKVKRMCLHSTDTAFALELSKMSFPPLSPSYNVY